MTETRPFRAVLAALAAASALALLFWPGGAGSTLSGAAELAWAGVRSSLALACLALAGALVQREPLAHTLLLAPSPNERRLPDLTLVLGILGLSQLLDLGLELTGALEESRLSVIDELIGQARGAQIVLAVVGLVLGPAAAEELLFRGLLLQGVSRRLGGVAALLLPAVLFGASHLELAHGAAAALLGVYLGAVTLATGRIRLAILCHAANNGLALADALLTARFADAAWAEAAANGFRAACVAGLGLSLWRLGRVLPEALASRPGTLERLPDDPPAG